MGYIDSKTVHVLVWHLLSDNYTCTEEQIKCGPGYCIAIDNRCDNEVDCKNGRDEHDCGK